MTDSDGTFDFESVSPGDYRLISTEDLDFEYANPQAIRPLLDGAKLVRVATGAVVDEHLELSPPARITAQ